MLPRSIYQLLPYFYIGMGLFLVYVVESRLVFLSTALLIAAGALVLWMRRDKDVEPDEYLNTDKTKNDEDAELLSDKSFDYLNHERRSNRNRSFPLVDNRDGMIAFDRRIHPFGQGLML